MITLDDAKKLQYGDILIDDRGKRWKVNGVVQTWKKPENAHRIRIPLKHGLYTYDYIDESFFPDGVCDLVTREDNA